MRFVRYDITRLYTQRGKKHPKNNSDFDFAR